MKPELPSYGPNFDPNAMSDVSGKWLQMHNAALAEEKRNGASEAGNDFVIHFSASHRYVVNFEDIVRCADLTSINGTLTADLAEAMLDYVSNGYSAIYLHGLHIALETALRRAAKRAGTPISMKLSPDPRHFNEVRVLRLKEAY